MTAMNRNLESQDGHPRARIALKSPPLVASRHPDDILHVLHCTTEVSSDGVTTSLGLVQGVLSPELFQKFDRRCAEAGIGRSFPGLLYAVAREEPISTGRFRVGDMVVWKVCDDVGALQEKLAGPFVIHGVTEYDNRNQATFFHGEVGTEDAGTLPFIVVYDPPVYMQRELFLVNVTTGNVLVAPPGYFCHTRHPSEAG